MRTAPLATAERTGLRFANGSSVEQLRALSTAELLSRSVAFAEQREHRIPLIIGNNSTEGFGQLPREAAPEAILRTYGTGADRALALYGLADGRTPAADPTLGDVGTQVLTDASFRCGAVIIARRHAAGGAPTWEYQFEQSLPGREAQGAAHSYELPYVFGNLLPSGFLGGAYADRDRGCREP